MELGIASKHTDMTHVQSALMSVLLWRYQIAPCEQGTVSERDGTYRSYRTV